MTNKTLKLGSKALDVVGVAGTKATVETPAVASYTREQLLAMLRELPGADAKDPTVDLPTGEIPRELIADKSALPPIGERASVPVQPPARLWGQHLTPSPIQSQVQQPGMVDPRTGNPFNQVQPASPGGSISPPPTRYFGRK